MEAGRALERHVASVHRGMVFLQREHLTLLAGLHVEISNLKRRCQELSCELDSRFPHRTTAEDEAQLTSRCEAARRLLEERRGATEAPGVRTERVRACVPRERVTSPQRPRPMPDPALFLLPPRWRGEAGDWEDDWEDVDEGCGLRGRVDMGGAEGETAL
ncbi:coiled-coil domain-containing protein 92-like [Hippocampus comes]|uniref:coiled-coil domain-containing protein 92-like n=1 Tax=Hippocampus comes TaxID=109280 RepID=UPI00094E2C77|nr:PREDICTED: coiled-coil domain-containing protein 92-like [Hippocampus comes]